MKTTNLNGFWREENDPKPKIYTRSNSAVSKKPKPVVKTKKKRRKPTKSNSFYMSWAWLSLRYDTLKEYGPVCMCCGSTKKIHVDHIKPRSKFPELALDPDNTQILCEACNIGKSNRDYTDFRPIKGRNPPLRDFV